jgi:methionyl-tRNA synthetase
MPSNYFYITTTAPYVNATPHIGFALEIIAADVIARFKQLQGNSVIFGTGTDEHGVNIYKKAQELQKDVQVYVDENAQTFEQLKDTLALSFTHFQRTTAANHASAAQHFWKLCAQEGDIYKKSYQSKYCTGCELEKTDSELVEGKCPLHPTKELDIIEEENYFFRFSKYREALLQLYESNQAFIVPQSKYKEMVSFATQGLKDFSISRLSAKMPWGVPVPDDPEHVMYVWFDALVFYISTLGWPDKTAEFSNYWPGVQIAGKDNLRQQAAMWQAMLMSAGLPPSKQILINGFISVDGQKMSKTLGNVIGPQEMIDRYGIDATRYLLMRLGPIGEDMDVSWEKFDTTYTADLANGLGNTVSRVAALCAKSGFSFALDVAPGFRSQFSEPMQDYQLAGALEQVWESLSYVDAKINDTKPWQLTGAPQRAILQELIAHLRQISFELQPFMPQVSAIITQHFAKANISTITPLFPRLE